MIPQYRKKWTLFIFKVAYCNQKFKKTNFLSYLSLVWTKVSTTSFRGLITFRFSVRGVRLQGLSCFRVEKNLTRRRIQHFRKILIDYSESNCLKMKWRPKIWIFMVFSGARGCSKLIFIHNMLIDLLDFN